MQEEVVDVVDLARAPVLVRHRPAGLLGSGVGPPVPRRLLRRRRHRRDQHDEVDRNPLAHHRCGEATQRLGHQNQVRAVADRLDHRVRVLGEARRVVVTRQVHGHHIVAAVAEQRLDPVPVPGIGPRAGNQDVGGHRRVDAVGGPH